VKRPSLNHKRVLVADDDESVRFVVSRTIQGLGCRVRVVEDGADVPDAVLDEPFHRLVLDLYMPGMNGFEVLRQLRHRDPDLLPTPKTPRDVRVLVISSESNAASIEHARAAGADAYITKPFDIDDLAERVRLLLS
jgi:two-component system nitrogen regulation response regulator GlnG